MEELAIIVEVLEEDLKTSTSRQSSNRLPICAQELGNKFLLRNTPHQGHPDEPPPTPSFYAATKKSHMQSVGIYGSAYSQAASLLTDTKIKNSSGESDHHIDRKQNEMTSSPSDSKEHVPSPEEISFSTKMDWWGSPHKIANPSYPCSGQEQWNSMTYFWTQMEREAHLLTNISNQELLSQDKKGRS